MRVRGMHERLAVAVEKARRKSVVEFCDVSAGLRPGRERLRAAQGVQHRTAAGTHDRRHSVDLNAGSGGRVTGQVVVRGQVVANGVRVTSADAHRSSGNGGLGVQPLARTRRHRPASAPQHRRWLSAHEQHLSGRDLLSSAAGNSSDSKPRGGSAWEFESEEFQQRRQEKMEQLQRRAVAEKARLAAEAEEAARLKELEEEAARVAAEAAAAEALALAEAAAAEAAERVAKAAERAVYLDAQEVYRRVLVPTAAERRRIFKKIDTNGSGSLSLTEIQLAAKELWPTRPILQERDRSFAA